jgi:hypothetical protein
MRQPVGPAQSCELIDFQSRPEECYDCRGKRKQRHSSQPKPSKRLAECCAQPARKGAENGQIDDDARKETRGNAQARTARLTFGCAGSARHSKPDRQRARTDRTRSDTAKIAIPSAQAEPAGRLEANF